MCGRFTLSATPEMLAEMFELGSVPNLRPRYNISPSQSVAVVRLDGASGERRLDSVRWGLVPAWAKDASIGSRLINARAETLAEKPSFRRPFRSRRCLVPADGFYEWQRTEGGRQPVYIYLRSRAPFAIAGLWDLWTPEGAESVESCTLVTMAANEAVAPLHDRMPALIAPRDYGTWLDPRVGDASRLQALLGGVPASEMAYHPVGRAVNSPANEGPDLVARST